MNPAIYAVGSYICTHLDKISVLYQAAETGSVVWQTSSAERFEQNAKVRSVFSSVSLLMTCVSALALFQGQWGLVSKAIRIVPGIILPMLSIPAIIGICGVMLGVGFVIAQAVNKRGDLKHLLPLDVSEERKDKISISRGLPNTIELFQATNGARVVVNLALAYFSANPYLFLATAGMEAVNLGVMGRVWSWIKYTEEFTTGLQHATKIKLTYFFPMFPVKGCKDHPMNEQEAVAHVQSQFQFFTMIAEDVRYDTLKSKKIAANQFESISYRIHLAENQLPDCHNSLCKNVISGHKDTEISVYDIRFPEADRWKKAEVFLVPDGKPIPTQSAFEAAAT